MKSASPSIIQVTRAPITTFMLSFIMLGHRRLEKELALPYLRINNKAYYKLPVDLFRVAGFPPECYEGIEELILEYDNGK